MSPRCLEMPVDAESIVAEHDAPARLPPAMRSNAITVTRRDVSVGEMAVPDARRSAPGCGLAFISHRALPTVTGIAVHGVPVIYCVRLDGVHQQRSTNTQNAAGGVPHECRHWELAAPPANRKSDTGRHVVVHQRSAGTEIYHNACSKSATTTFAAAIASAVRHTITPKHRQSPVSLTSCIRHCRIFVSPHQMAVRPVAETYHGAEVVTPDDQPEYPAGSKGKPSSSLIRCSHSRRQPSRWPGRLDVASVPRSAMLAATIERRECPPRVGSVQSRSSFRHWRSRLFTFGYRREGTCRTSCHSLITQPRSASVGPMPDSFRPARPYGHSARPLTQPGRQYSLCFANIR